VSQASDAYLRFQVEARSVLGPGGLIALVHERWEARSGQLEMAEALEARLRAGGVIAIEAPTGIGKTLAYLVPALLSGKRVIVSTNTKTLQDQIVGKDLPLLTRAFARAGIDLVRAAPDLEPPEPSRIRYALMKGRSNYLCLDRLDRLRRQGHLAFMDPGEVVRKIARWSEETLRGDRAELFDVPDDIEEWGDLDARAETCVGLKCARHDECFVVRMRREAATAQLIVVNHHLLLADLALRAEAAVAPEGRAFGEVIPSADALIIDEAHALEETASEYFGGEVSSGKLTRFTRDAMQWVAARPAADAIALGEQLTEAVARAEAVFASIPSGTGRVRIFKGAEGGEDPFERLRKTVREAEPALHVLSARLEGWTHDPMAESLSRRAQAMADAISFISRAESSDFVYWAERKGLRARLGAAPIDVADLLGAHLFSAFRTVALTSATLADGSGLDYFLGRVGAPKCAERLVLETPFDYPSQAALYVPRDLPPPDHPRAPESIAKTGRELIELVGGGAFFLFTSHRMMREVCDRLRRRLSYPVLLQGEAPKAALIRSFIERSPAVLFATASFWEGVDVPGDPLRLVMIDRLPFAAPSDPVVAARLERLESLGESGFSSYQVPQAILRLRQGFGRLVRSRHDRGVVAILDGRIHAKAYGRRFLEALPRAHRIDSHELLVRWVQDNLQREVLAG
jgi:ATP-dependent DNA helicase DinG